MSSTATALPLLLLLLLALAQADIADISISKSSVSTYRQMVYEQTEERINRYNAAFGDTYTAVHNAFSHLTPDEFRAMHMGGSLSPPGSAQRAFVNDPSAEEKASLNLNANGLKMNVQTLINDILPNNGVFSVDYTGPTYSLVTAVKDQGACGSCWAFAGIAEIESFYLSRHKMYLDLSEQQMVDCVTALIPATQGCSGGQMDSVAFYAVQLNVAQEKYYPYQAANGVCSQAKINVGGGFKISGYTFVEGCTQIASTLLATRPFAVCGSVDDQWQTYGSGVLTSCTTGNVGGHCVLLVGVFSDGTTTQSTNYFKYRNSWGTNWGMGGYINTYRDPKNQTGLCGLCGGILSY